MNKAFKKYALIWAIVLAVFNIICFVTPSEAAGVSKYNSGFWTGYVFITVAFIGQLYCAHLAFKVNSLKKLFYNIPLISISYYGLVAMLIMGGISMVAPQIPTWIGIIVCVVILAFTAIAIIETIAATDVVKTIDEKVGEKTSFIKNIRVETESLLSVSKDDDIKKDCKAVYEALKYSDPMSNNELNEIESQIEEKVKRFGNSVKEGNAEDVSTIKDELVFLIDTRNAKCKLLKG